MIAVTDVFQIFQCGLNINIHILEMKHRKLKKARCPGHEYSPVLRLENSPPS